MIKRVRRKTRT